MAKFGPRRRPPGVGEEQRRRPKEKWCRRREKGFWCLLAATSWHLRARLGGGGRSSTPGIGVVRELHVPHSQGCTSVHKRHICHPDHVARQAFRRRVGGHESGGGESGGACVEASRTSGTLWRRQPFWGRASDGGAGTPTKAGRGATRTEEREIINPCKTERITVSVSIVGLDAAQSGGCPRFQRYPDRQ